MAKSRIPLISFAIIGILILGLQSLLINPKQEAFALQAVNIATNGSVIQIKYALYGTTPAFVAVEGSPPTQIQVINANNSQVLRSFNMTNALMNGFNIVYSVLNMDCNSSLQLCVIGYDTGGSGTCSMSPNLCRDRVVLVDYKNGAWSSLKTGYNYTYTTNVLGTVAFSFGQTQFNIFATYQPNGGGNSLIDTLVFNSTDGVNAHPLILGNTFNTATAVAYSVAGLGTFTLSGVCCNNFEAEGSQSTTTFIDFYRNTNSAGCSVNVGSAVRDIQYVSDNLGTFWYVAYGTTLSSISQTATTTCTVVSSVNLSALTGGNNLNSIAVDSTRHEIYTQSNGKVYVINETSFSSTPLLSFASPTTNINSYHNDLASYPNGNNGALAVPWGATAKLLIQYWNVQGGGSNPNPPPNNPCGAVNSANCEGQINCELPANVNLAMCQGTPAGGGGGNAFNNGVSVLNNTGAVISQGIGLSNNNIKTNGVGYIFLAVALILGNIMWLLAVHNFGNKGIVVPQPVFVSALLSFSIIFGFVLMGITDPLILIIGIVALVAFSAPKAVSMIRGGGQTEVAS